MLGERGLYWLKIQLANVAGQDKYGYCHIVCRGVLEVCCMFIRVDIKPPRPPFRSISKTLALVHICIVSFDTVAVWDS